MSEQQKLVNQLQWCIESKKALEKFYRSCTDAQREVQKAYMILQGSNFEECNKELEKPYLLFQKSGNELASDIIEAHLPYIQKQIDALSQFT